jgi:hypothetical protein
MSLKNLNELPLGEITKTLTEGKRRRRRKTPQVTAYLSRDDGCEETDAWNPNTDQAKLIQINEKFLERLSRKHTIESVLRNTVQVQHSRHPWQHIHF